MAAQMQKGRAHVLDYFDRIYVISLKSRPDRREATAAELARVGYDPARIEWIDAVRPDGPGAFMTIGERGCFMSHLVFLEKASGQDFKQVLLLEDDAEFVKDFNAILSRIVDHLQGTDWQLFYGGGYVDDVEPIAPNLARVASATPIVSTHCVAFRGALLPRLKTYLEAQLARPPHDPAGGPMPVDGSYSWARRELGLETYVAMPNICRERPTRSDITPVGWWDKTPVVREAAERVRRLRQWVRAKAKS